MQERTLSKAVQIYFQISGVVKGSLKLKLKSHPTFGQIVDITRQTIHWWCKIKHAVNRTLAYSYHPQNFRWQQFCWSHWCSKLIYPWNNLRVASFGKASRPTLGYPISKCTYFLPIPSIFRHFHPSIFHFTLSSCVRSATFVGWQLRSCQRAATRKGTRGGLVV